MVQSKIDIIDEVLMKSSTIGECSVIGKLLLDHKISKDVVGSMLIKLWRVDSKTLFKEIGPNKIIITFTCCKEKD